MAAKQNSSILGEAKPSKAIVKLALPATLALLAKAVYNIVDSRYRAKRPVSLTTNLGIDEMKETMDIRYSRIYDRIFEMCYPMQFKGQSWRKAEAAHRFDEMRKFLEGD